jgi:hypothetical protein
MIIKTWYNLTAPQILDQLSPVRAVCSSVVLIDRLGRVDGVPDKKALAALKEAKRKLDYLYREVTNRKARRAT